MTLNASQTALSVLAQKPDEPAYAPGNTGGAESTQKLMDKLARHAVYASAEQPASSNQFNAMYYISQQPQGVHQSEGGLGMSAYQGGAEPSVTRAKSSQPRRGAGCQVRIQTQIARQIS